MLTRPSSQSVRRGVYFTGKNLGRVVDSEDEDEDLQADDVTVPEEFPAADAGVNMAALDHGESETDCNLGDVEATPEVVEAAPEVVEAAGTEDCAADLGTGMFSLSDAGTGRNVSTSKTTRKKYKSRLEYIEENTTLKNQLTEMENEMSAKDKIIEELRSELLQLKKK